MIRIVFIPAFLRQFEKLDSELRDDALEKIEAFKDRANHARLRVHKLRGPLAGQASFSVNYKYRIVFQYVSRDEAVLLAIGDHDVYD